MNTAEEVKDFLLHGGICDVHTRVKSNFVCDVIRDIESKGKFPYNSDVYDEIGRLLGIDLPPYYAKVGDNQTKIRLFHGWCITIKNSGELTILQMKGIRL